MRYILLILTLCWMTACTTDADPIPPAPTATTVVSATATTETVMVEQTEEPSPVPSVEATEPATEVMTDTMVLDCEVPSYPAFESSWEAAHNESICPIREVEIGEGAIQTFENGTMIWVSESDEEPAYIYVINSDNTWQRYEDLFEEGDTESANLTPPAGLLEPIRGFGLVWRDQLDGSDAAIGWALNEEVGHEAAVQEFGNDTAIAIDDRVYWLLSDGTWE